MRTQVFIFLSSIERNALSSRGRINGDTDMYHKGTRMTLNICLFTLFTESTFFPRAYAGR